MDVLWRDRAAGGGREQPAPGRVRRAARARRRRDRAPRRGAPARGRGRRRRCSSSPPRTRAAPVPRPPTARRSRSTRGELLPENRYDDWADERRDELAELATDLEDELGGARRRRRPAQSPPARRARARSSGASASSPSSERCSAARACSRWPGPAVWARRGSRSSSRATPSRRTPAGAALVELAAVTDARARRGRGRGRARRAGADRAELVDAVIDFLAPRALLLVLDNCEHLLAGDGRAGRRAAALGAAAHDPRHQPRAAARAGRGRVPGARRSTSPTPSSAHAERAHRLRGRAALRRAGARRRARASRSTTTTRTDVARICFRLDGLPLALELAAGRLGALGPGRDRGAARRPLPRAPRRQPRRADAPADAHRDARVEPRPARSGRAHAVPAAGGVRGRLRPRGGRGRLRRRRPRAGGHRRPRSRGSSRSRWSWPTRRPRASAATACSRPFACTRASGSTRRARTSRSPSATPAGRSPWREHERGSPRLDRDAANLRAALDTLLARAPGDALRLCVALLPFWLRRIDLHEAQRRFDEALAAAPERTSSAGEALLAAAAIDLRSGALAAGARARRGEPRGRRGDRRPARASGGRSSSSASSASRPMRPTSRAGGSSARSSSRAARASPAARGDRRLLARRRPLDPRRPAPRRGARGREHRPASARSRARPSGSRRRSTSPRSARAGSAAGPALRMVFEDTLQPFVGDLLRRRRELRAGQPGRVVRARGDLERARGAARRERGAVRGRRRRAGPGGGARRGAGTSTSPTARFRRRARRRGGPGAAARAARPPRAGARALRARARRHDGRRLRRAPTGIWPRRARSSGALATAGDSPARCGGRPTSRSRAAASTTREAALEEARAVLGPTQRERWIANTLVGLAEVAALRGDAERCVGAARRRPRALRRARRRASASPTSTSGSRELAKRPLRRAKTRRIQLPHVLASERKSEMTQTIAPVLGEATVQELREAVRGDVVTPVGRRLRRGGRSGTAPTTAAGPRSSCSAPAPPT